MTNAENDRLEEFRALISQRLGLFFDNGKNALLRDVLKQRCQEARYSDSWSYLQFLSTSSSKAEWQRLAENLTVTETYFFRNADQFRSLCEAVLPSRINARLSSRRLRILSAGCASGEEPYSLAMTIMNHFPELASWDVRIVGVDINHTALEKARAGRYSAWALRETSDRNKERYFRLDGREFFLSDFIRDQVDFQERNLIEANADLWHKEFFDIIFCRNMVMYWNPPLASELAKRMADALAPNGFLFLGHAETLRGISQDFHLCQTHQTFYYQRKPNPLPSSLPTPGQENTLAGGAPSVSWNPSTTWVDVIHAASEKIAALASRHVGSPVVVAADSRRQTKSAWDLAPALDLLRQERFRDAMQVLQTLPEESKNDPDVQLLHAILLTNAGDLAGAMALCRRLLALDDLNAGAHYLAALCCEQAGDRAAAQTHDRAAIYLDETFAMPWLHLGLLARRMGRRDEALRHLQQAMTLLAKEEASRILLFGGGFGREALLQFCASEIAVSNRSDSRATESYL